jgi:hypothetical protein
MSGLVYLGKTIEVRGFAVVGSQFTFQGNRKESFVSGKELPESSSQFET